MLTVSERATVEFEELLRVNNAAPGQGVKLVPSGPANLGLVIDIPREGDEVIRKGGEPLVIVDNTIAEDLDGAEIDCDVRIVNGQPKAQFTLLPPSDLR